MYLYWYRSLIGGGIVHRTRVLIGVGAVLAGALLLAPASRAGDAFEPVGIADAGHIVDVGEPVTFSLVQLVNRSGAPVTITDVRLLPDTHGYPPLACSGPACSSGSSGRAGCSGGP